MSKASGANRLGLPHLRLVRGGAKSPPRRGEFRPAEMRRAIVFSCVGLAVLLVSLAMLAALAVIAAYRQFENVPRVALPMFGLCAALVALGIALSAGALHHLLRMQRRAGAGGEKSQLADGDRGLSRREGPAE